MCILATGGSYTLHIKHLWSECNYWAALISVDGAWARKDQENVLVLKEQEYRMEIPSHCLVSLSGCLAPCGWWRNGFLTLLCWVVGMSTEEGSGEQQFAVHRMWKGSWVNSGCTGDVVVCVSSPLLQHRIQNELNNGITQKPTLHSSPWNLTSGLPKKMA